MKKAWNNTNFFSRCTSLWYNLVVGFLVIITLQYFNYCGYQAFGTFDRVYYYFFFSFTVLSLPFTLTQITALIQFLFLFFFFFVFSHYSLLFICWVFTFNRFTWILKCIWCIVFKQQGRKERQRERISENVDTYFEAILNECKWMCVAYLQVYYHINRHTYVYMQTRAHIFPRRFCDTKYFPSNLCWVCACVCLWIWVCAIV